ncbi:MAG: thioredoxin-dependent thiol peroxidase [Hyphomicrobiaceae bacterium]
MPLTAGQPAPDFDLPADNGKNIQLSRLKGRPAVVYFYPKDDTPGCTVEAIDFTRLAAEFARAGATIIGISPDSVADHCKFRDKHDLGIRLAADEDKAVAMAYGVWVEKKNYGKTYMGIERTTVLVDKAGLIAKVWRRVKVQGHAEKVLEAVKAL